MPNLDEQQQHYQQKLDEEMINSGGEESESSTGVAVPLVRFGLITDVQYADVEDGYSYDKTKRRYYRNSLTLVREAAKNWSERKSPPIKFVLQLGDLIDGKCKSISDSKSAMHKCIDELGKSAPQQPQLLHIWGNHEMYNFMRDDLLNSPLNTAREFNQNLDSRANYYTYQVTSKLRLICLDYYEYSIIGYPETDPIYKDAIEYLRKHNKNSDLNSVADMRGHALRFSGFNGSIGPRQLAWLRSELDSCRSTRTHAIVCGHLPVHAQAADVRCLAWNAKDVLELLWAYEDTVLAYFAGHDHEGGYFRDKKNIHHLTLHAVIETPPNSNAYATVDVLEDRVKVEGVGVIGYYDIMFKRD